ncbi:glutamine-hydrolyzing GMP synthase [Candidatus Micrarchaeota archaeon]|nr:glutamine-hydrolyzing GMP synthase [Candidatus Micrarchaeota archaeon]
MILIIDNGSQYTHLIKRNCRELGQDAEMLYAKADYSIVEEMMKTGLGKIIISGGPKSVYEEAPNIGTKICEKVRDNEIRLPLLGICYGHQMIAHVFGGRVEKGSSAEYGFGEIEIDDGDVLFKDIPKKLKVWVSHYDQVVKVPEGFAALAHSDACAIEAMKHLERHIYGVQFHPEVWHTDHGGRILANFLECKS